MKILATILIVIALLWCIVPRSSADLNAWNDGQNASITVSNIVAKGSITGNQSSFTGTLTATNGSTGNTLNINANGSGTWPLNITSNGVFVAGVTNNGQFLESVGSAGLPSFSFNGANTAGLYLSGASPAISVAGARVGFFSADGWNGPVLLGTTAYVTSPGANQFQLGKNGTSASVQTLQGATATGTDHNGFGLNFTAGASTGSGVPGDVIFSTSLYTNGSGSAVNATTTRGQIVGRPCALTNNTATSFQRFTMATNTQAGISLFCTVKATDAAFARQSISSNVRVDAVNVNGTITATVSETDNTLAASTGTLTIAYTVVDEGSNVLAIRANANTSLTATPSIKWVIQSINSDGAITVTPVQL